MDISKNLDLNNIFSKKNFKNITGNILDKFILIIALYIVIRYSLDFKVVYPQIILEMYEETLFKMFLYLLLFIIMNYNLTYGILYFIFLMFLEFDNILFMKED